mmetsp:Transcript_10864/g.16757  ORF Transcript_10864/g.16757 Transcript_10864/m.16757 type:complete len:746 (-) Transcript_10864:76-2313(-)
MLSRMPHRNRFTTALLALTCTSSHNFSALCFGATSLHQSASTSVKASSALIRGSSNTARTAFVSNFYRGGATRMASSTTDEDTTTMAEVGDEPVDPQLVALREHLAKLELDVYLVPSDDPHLSEYVPDAYKRRAFLTNFHGSAGTAVVLPSEAMLWTDSRYFNEASLSLSSHWKLMKSGQPKVPSISKYVAELALDHYQETGKSLRVGMDPYVHSASFVKELEDAFEKSAATLSSDECKNESDKKIGTIDSSSPNLVDVIWGEDRPPVPTSPFRVHPLEYAGMSVQDKISKIHTEMKTKKATLSVFSTLDDVAYLFNMRAMGDVETCPVGIAYATIEEDAHEDSHVKVTLYCDSKKVQSEDVQQHLKEAGVTIAPYDDIVGDVKAHCEQDEKHNKVWIDKSRANYAICGVISAGQLIDSQNAITPLKACKNAAEMEGMRQAHIVDGAAMANFISWLEHAIVTEGRSVSEVEIDRVLTGERAKQPGFLEVSFPTIAGVASNGAIIHYSAKEDSELLKYMDITTPILIDSGGQYTYGTTDVTRTWHFGTPTPKFVDAYTRVLKGNIGVDTMVFPENTPGFVLDVFARKALWDNGMDYGHGTGHGVGAALNVHEGPHSISPRWANTESLKKGMVVSNEPGYYEDGNFGIRIENLIEISYVKPEHNEAKDDDDEDSKSTEKKFLKFDKLTMIPIQKSLIDVSLMTEAELDWLDEYHAIVFEKISPLLDAGSPAMEWLVKSCAKIDRSGK